MRAWLCSLRLRRGQLRTTHPRASHLSSATWRRRLVTGSIQSRATDQGDRFGAIFDDRAVGIGRITDDDQASVGQGLRQQRQQLSCKLCAATVSTTLGLAAFIAAVEPKKYGQ